MSVFFKRDLPIIVLSITGFALILEWFIPIAELTTLKGYLSTFASVIAYVAFGVGTFYGVTSELAMLRRNRTPTQYIITASFFTIMILTFGVSLYYGTITLSLRPAERSPFEGVRSSEFQWYLYGIYMPVVQAMYAVMFLYQCGALYRVLRARSMETTVLMICGMAYILRSIPLFVSFTPGLLELGDYMASGPGLGGTRAATATAAVGALIVAIRALLGKEQTTIEVR